MNLTPLVRAGSRGLIGLRSGQREREQLDQEEEQRQLRNMLAIFGERRQQEQADALMGLRDQTTQDRVREATAKAMERQRRLSVLMKQPGMDQETAEALADDDVAFRDRIKPPTPPTPRNIDPLSPEGIKASGTREEQLARIRARFRIPPESEVPTFLRPNAIQNRAAQLTQPWMQNGIEVSPGREPSDAAGQARKDIENQRRAAFEAERDELKALYQAAYERADTDELKDRATRAYTEALDQLAKKYRIGTP